MNIPTTYHNNNNNNNNNNKIGTVSSTCEPKCSRLSLAVWVTKKRPTKMSANLVITKTTSHLSR